MHLVASSSCSSLGASFSEEALRHPNERPPAGTTCPFPFNDPTNAPTATARTSSTRVSWSSSGPLSFSRFPDSVFPVPLFFFLVPFRLPSCAVDRENSTGPEVVFLADGDRLKVRATLVSATSHVLVTY